MFKFDRKQQSSVKQLSFNKKINKKTPPHLTTLTDSSDIPQYSHSIPANSLKANTPTKTQPRSMTVFEELSYSGFLKETTQT